MSRLLPPPVEASGLLEPSTPWDEEEAEAQQAWSAVIREPQTFVADGGYLAADKLAEPRQAFDDWGGQLYHEVEQMAQDKAAATDELERLRVELGGVVRERDSLLQEVAGLRAQLEPSARQLEPQERESWVRERSALLQERASLAASLQAAEEELGRARAECAGLQSSLFQADARLQQELLAAEARGASLGASQGKRQAEQEARSRQDSAERRREEARARESERHRLLDAVAHLPRSQTDRTHARQADPCFVFAGPDEKARRCMELVRREWQARGDGGDVLAELLGNLRQPRGAPSSSGEPEPLTVRSLAKVHAALRRSLDDAARDNELQRHSLSLCLWRLYGMLDVDVDRLLGFRDCPRLPPGQDDAESRGHVYDPYRDSRGRDRNAQPFTAVSQTARRCMEQLDEGSARHSHQRGSWIKYLCFLGASAQRLPSPLTVAQGLTGLPDSVVEQWRRRKPGDRVFLAAPASTVRDAEVSRSHCSSTKPVTNNVLLKISGVTEALPLERLSGRPEEGEVLLPPFSWILVDRVVRARDDEPLEVECTFDGCEMSWSSDFRRSVIDDLVRASGELDSALRELEREEGEEREGSGLSERERREIGDEARAREENEVFRKQLEAHELLHRRRSEKQGPDLWDHVESGKHDDRDHQETLRLLDSALEQLGSLQDSNVRQTRQFAKFKQGVAEERDRLHQSLAELQETITHEHDLQSLFDQWRLDQNHLHSKYDDLRLQERERVAAYNRHLDHQERRKDHRLRRKHYDYNIAHHMDQAINFTHRVDKICFKNNRKTEVRFVSLEDSKNFEVAPPRLVWAKDSHMSNPHGVNLDEVTAILYGMSASGPRLMLEQEHNAHVDPSSCFTLVTPKRTFDFICTSDTEAEHFVLSISRLCRRLRGWPIHGSLERHAEFVAARGWCKIELWCRQQKITLTEAVLHGIRRTANVRSGLLR